MWLKGGNASDDLMVQRLARLVEVVGEKQPIRWWLVSRLDLTSASSAGLTEAYSATFRLEYSMRLHMDAVYNYLAIYPYRSQSWSCAKMLYTPDHHFVDGRPRTASENQFNLGRVNM